MLRIVIMFSILSLFPQNSFAKDLLLSGSSTLFPVAKKAAKAFEKKTGKKVAVSGGGSSNGVKNALAGKALGMASRKLKSKEESSGAVAHTLGLDGIVIVVHKDNPITGLTTAQIKDIYEGKVKDWKDVGSSKPGAIKAFGPDSSHGTNGAFLSMTKAAEDKLVYTGRKNVKKIFGDLASNKDAIAFSSYGMYSVKDRSKAMKLVEVDGKAPSLASIKDGSYPLVRPLNLVTKGEPAGIQKTFIEYILSAEGQKFVQEENYVPIN